jgi:hypothetical protein
MYFLSEAVGIFCIITIYVIERCNDEQTINLKLNQAVRLVLVVPM